MSNSSADTDHLSIVNSLSDKCFGEVSWFQWFLIVAQSCHNFLLQNIFIRIIWELLLMTYFDHDAVIARLWPLEYKVNYSHKYNQNEKLEPY